MKSPGQPREAGEGDAIFLMRLLHAGGAQVFEDHLREIGHGAVARRRLSLALAGFQHIDQFVVPIDGERAMRREAFDSERPSDADAVLVDVRLVVEILESGLGGDGGVDLLFQGNASLPPFGVGVFGGGSPFGVRHARDFPCFPCFAERRVQSLPRQRQRLLPFVRDDVDLGVVGDGTRCNVRAPSVDESMADVAMCRCALGRRARDLAFFALAVNTVGEEIVRVACAHEARAGEGKRDPRCVDSDPASTPLLGDIGGCAGAAGRIQNEIAGVGGHEDATFDQPFVCLNNVYLI